MTIVTITISTVDYTSYASVAEADDFLAVDPKRSVAWIALTDDQKGARLVAATRRLDLLNWSGERADGDDVQDAQWPRTGVVYPDGSAVSESEVPQDVEDATAVTAGSIELDAKNADVGTSGSNTKKVGAGKTAVEFFRPTSGVAMQDETAYKLVQPFLTGPASGDVGGLSSGTDGSSTFSDIDNWGRTKGFP
jgi:hypothetical protein